MEKPDNGKEFRDNYHSNLFTDLSLTTEYIHLTNIHRETEDLTELNVVTKNWHRMKLEIFPTRSVNLSIYGVLFIQVASQQPSVAIWN